MNKNNLLSQILKKNIKSLAQELAWKDLSTKKKQKYLEQAKLIEEDKLTKSALKALKQAEKAFSEEGFVSRADPDVYNND